MRVCVAAAVNRMPAVLLLLPSCHREVLRSLVYSTSIEALASSTRERELL